jgi:hypothetical protein
MDVARALMEGYAFPCACCRKLWRARDRGSDVCEAGLTNQACGGPVIGLAFPLYEGPLTPQALATLCFRCGKPASKFIETQSSPGRYLGLCKRHEPLLNRIVPVDDLVRRPAAE